MILTIYKHTDEVTCLEILKNRDYFISGGKDGLINIFDINLIEK